MVQNPSDFTHRDAARSVLVSEILSRAADLIEPEGCWTQEAERRNAAGQDIDADVDPADPDSDCEAVCWCMAGAIVAVSPLSILRWDALGAVKDVIGEDYIPDWNDDDTRTQAEVVAALRAASQKAAVADREQPGTQSRSDGVNNDPTP